MSELSEAVKLMDKVYETNIPFTSVLAAFKAIDSGDISKAFSVLESALQLATKGTLYTPGGMVRY